MGMPAGKRDRRITIWRRTMVRNGNNDPVFAWVERAQVWAEKLDISDSEKMRAAQAGAQITTRFRMLWSERVSGMNPKDRIAFAGLEYDIVGVKEIGRREGLEVTATALSDN